MRMFIVILTLSLCGCFSKERVIVQVQKVEVPVPVAPPAPPDFEPVMYPVDKLSQNSTDKEVTQAYFDSVVLCRSEVQKRDNVLNTYRNYKPSSEEKK